MSTKQKAPTPATTTTTTKTTDTDHLSSLLHNASLTNSELFGAILSVIKSSKSIGRNAKQWIHNSVQGYDAISSIVHKAAVGADGCVTEEDWIREFNDVYNDFQPEKEATLEKECSSGENGVSRSLGSIVRDMPTDGHALRLRLALEAVEAAATTHNADTAALNSGSDAKNIIMTVRQAVKLLRGTALVGNAEQQSRALNCLVHIVPRLASHPLEILAMVQTPTLRLLDWKCLEEMCAFVFKSDSQRHCFQAMINYGAEEYDCTEDEKNDGLS